MKLIVNDKKEVRLANYNDFVILVSTSKDFELFKKIFEYNNVPLSIEADTTIKEDIALVLLKNLLLLTINIYNKNTTPTVFGVGINDVGDSCHILYQRWVNMIGRCYSKKHCQYNSYGAKGVIVEDYLLRFSNYVNFISSLKNYDLLVDNPQNYQIDKDIKCGRQSIYSRETISIVEKRDNLEEENKGKRVAIARYTLDDEFIDEFESICKASKATNIPIGNIAKCVRKESKTAGGYKWVSLTNNK